MASAESVKDAIKLLLAAFPSAKFDLKNAGAWAQLLEDVGDDQLEAAAEDWARTGDWFPTLPELRRKALASDVGVATGKDNLAVLRVGLERRAAGGEFDPAEWEKLAESFEAEGRASGAEAIRRRADRIASPPDPEERRRYATCLEELREQERDPAHA